MNKGWNSTHELGNTNNLKAHFLEFKANLKQEIRNILSNINLNNLSCDKSNINSKYLIEEFT